MFTPTAPNRTLRPVAISPRDLRKMIPTVALLKTMTQVALCGVLPKLDPNSGEEVGPAAPVTPAESVAAAKYLLDKALPALKSEEDSTDTGFDRTRLRDLSKDDIRRMTKQEVEAALEASFTLEVGDHDPGQSVSPDAPPLATGPANGPSADAAEPAGDVREGEVERPSPD